MHLLSGSRAEFDLGLQLRDAEDPLTALFLEGIFDLEEVSDLLESLSKLVILGLAEALEVRLGHLLRDLGVVDSHVLEEIAEVNTSTFARVDHLGKDFFMRDDSLVHLIQRIFRHHGLVRDHDNDRRKDLAKVRACIGASHLSPDLPSLVVRALLLENEVTEIVDHVVFEVELNTYFVCLALLVDLNHFEINFISTKGHEVVEDLKELLKVSPLGWRSLLQKPDHLHHELDADGLGDLLSLVFFDALIVRHFACDGLHLFRESDFLLFDLELAKSELDNSSKVLPRNFIGAL